MRSIGSVRENSMFKSIHEVNGVVSHNISKEEINHHFQKYEDEVLYVIDDNQRMQGIISPGDFYRYLIGEKSEIINEDYTFLEDMSFEAANDIFIKKRMLNEIPIIKDGKFLGVITNGKKKRKEEWDRIRKSHTDNLMMRNKIHFHKGQCEKIISEYKKNNVGLYIVEYPTMKTLHLTNEDFGEKFLYSDDMSGFQKMSEYELEKYYAEDYYSGKEIEFAHDFNQITTHFINGRMIVDDIDTTHIKVREGHRYIENAPTKATHKVFLVGPCNVFGAYVQDNRTIGYYLQKILNQENMDTYEVVISASMGGADLSPLFCEEIGSGDIVIFFAIYHQLKLAFDAAIENLECQFRKIDVTDAFDREKDIVGNLFNSLAHHNHIINRNIAECIWQQVDFKVSEDMQNENIERIAIQDYYIGYDVAEYYQNMKNKVPNAKGSIGAIVMNCNPFTKGHRYLIEQAKEQVDFLYIFVVEEDRSIYKFEDRIEMVRSGTVDLKNVQVVPSGKYILSQDTFSQYFEKDNVEQIEDMDYDVRIFGEVVAKELGISVRFVGEEPFDKVTRKYNETMKSILPEYGIRVVEIPRTTLVDGITISASAVRKALSEGNMDIVQNMLPDSTLEYLKLKQTEDNPCKHKN